MGFRRSAVTLIALSLLLSVFSIAGCNGGGDSQHVVGRAVKGPVLNGGVTVYQLNADGSRGSVLKNSH